MHKFAIIQLIIGFVWVLFTPQAQQTSPLRCIADAENIILRSRYGKMEISPELWNVMVEVEGLPLWGGYDGDNSGWQVPDNIHSLWNLHGYIDGNIMRLWVWTDDNGYYYLFAFYPWIKTDSQGNFGYHPCGNGRIDASVWQGLTEITETWH